MMKKLFFAAFALCALAACSEKLGPEYTTLPVISDMKQVAATITSADKGRISATVSSQYGLDAVTILYYLDDKSTDVKSVSVSCNKSPEAITQPIEGVIPAQAYKTKVTYQFLAFSAYGVAGASAVGSYTVADVITPLPDPDPDPDPKE